MVALSRSHHCDPHHQHLKINQPTDGYTPERENTQSRLGRKVFKSSKEFLLLFPTCPSPPELVSTWRGGRCGPHLLPLSGGASSAGAAACTGHRWDRRLSWQSRGKPACASSCTAREKESKVGKGSVRPAGSTGSELGSFRWHQHIAKGRAGCVGASFSVSCYSTVKY